MKVKITLKRSLIGEKPKARETARSLGLKKINTDNAAVAVCKSVELYIPLGDLVNKDQEISKLNKRLEELNKLILSIEKKLSNKEFVSKAPENVINGEKNKLKDFIIERTKILSNIEVLKWKT